MSVADQIRQDPREYLDTLRLRVLRLHKALIQAERRRYERMHGRIQSEYQVLALLSNDPLFAWLRPMTVYIVELEEKLDDKAGVNADDAAQFGDALYRLMTGGDRFGTFHRSYVKVLQDEADIVMHHGQVMPMLPKPKTEPEAAESPAVDSDDE